MLLFPGVRLTLWAAVLTRSKSMHPIAPRRANVQLAPDPKDGSALPILSRHVTHLILLRRRVQHLS